MLHRAGDMVDIDGFLIPACNIQVEGVPGVLTLFDGYTQWFGVYFEIMFEDGDLWVVDQGSNPNDLEHIHIAQYVNWANGYEIDKDYIPMTFTTWEQVVAAYKRKAKPRAPWILANS